MGRGRVNFGRTGELLYLMLCRSSSAQMLKPHLESLLSGKNQWDALLRLMQPDIEEPEFGNGKSYLPYKTHPQFDLLGEDWLRIFELKLPAFDALPHLVLLGALHVMLYQLSVASTWCNEDVKVHFVCEIVAPKKTLVRELSGINFQENNELTTQAIESYISRIENGDDWKRANSEAMTPLDAFMRCQKILETEVSWGINYDGIRDSATLIKTLSEDALARHKQHVANVHRSYGKAVGLVSRRGTNKNRYAPNDSLLKTLLFANVPRRMELHEALERLYNRYGLVVGEAQAQHARVNTDFDRKAFQDNAHRLEQRLSSLGLLRRMSDACAYVENPHAPNNV